MTRSICLIVYMIALSWASAGHAVVDDSEDSLEIPSLKTLRPMNNINPAPYDKFWRKWDLVTVRYRDDNGEQRFIYANDVAIRAMKEGRREFPNGSVFGKIAFLAEDDPEFPNSKEPTNFTRMQIMVKNKNLYRKTDGWGYWLYVDGATAKSAEDEAVACHACHTIVKERDFIFAIPTFMGRKAEWYGTLDKNFGDFFMPKGEAQLSEYEKKVLAVLENKPASIKSYKMRLFSGSLHESLGPLSQFVKDGSVCMLFDPVKKRFVMAEPLPPTADCQNRAFVYMDRRKAKSENGRRVIRRDIRKGLVCNGVNRWVKSMPTPQELW